MNHPAAPPTIEAIDVFRVVVPLPEPLRVWGRAIDKREFVFVRARAGGRAGTGFALSRGLALDAVVSRQIAPGVVGKPVGSMRAIWNATRAAARMTGGEGIYARALSLVDIALWDLYGQLIDTPLWRSWGGAQSSVPCLAICGYYRTGSASGDWRADSLAAVKAEAERLCAAGYTRFKIPVGEDAALDADRVRLLRAIAGPAAQIGVDASGVFNTLKDAAAAIQTLTQAGIDFFEDPFPASEWQRATVLAAKSGMRVAYGESITSTAIMQQLCGRDGVDMPRPDGTVLGGPTGFMQSVAPALEHNTPIFPHYYPDLHAPLAGALGLTMIEESPDEADTVGFGVLRASQPVIARGAWQLTERSGLGLDWDEDAIARFRVLSPES